MTGFGQPAQGAMHFRRAAREGGNVLGTAALMICNWETTRMPLMRHLIVEGSSSSVDNGGARTISYHTLYLPNAVHETSQQCFATDGALLTDMLGRQRSVIAA